MPSRPSRVSDSPSLGKTKNKGALLSLSHGGSPPAPQHWVLGSTCASSGSGGSRVEPKAASKTTAGGGARRRAEASEAAAWIRAKAPSSTADTAKKGLIGRHPCSASEAPAYIAKENFRFKKKGSSHTHTHNTKTHGVELTWKSRNLTSQSQSRAHGANIGAASHSYVTGRDGSSSAPAPTTALILSAIHNATTIGLNEGTQKHPTTLRKSMQHLRSHQGLQHAKAT